MAKNILSSEEIVKSFKDEFKTKITDSRIEKHIRGLKKTEIEAGLIFIAHNLSKLAH